MIFIHNIKPNLEKLKRENSWKFRKLEIESVKSEKESGVVRVFVRNIFYLVALVVVRVLTN